MILFIANIKNMYIKKIINKLKFIKFYSLSIFKLQLLMNLHTTLLHKYLHYTIASLQLLSFLIIFI